MTPDGGKLAVKNRITLVLIACLFLLPVLLAFVLYAAGWRPSSTINHGEIVEPARLIDDLELHTLQSGKLRIHDLHRRWTLIYFGPSECESLCERSLYKMRQVRLAQGDNAERIQRLFVLLDVQALDKLRQTLKDYAGMRVATGPSGNVRALAAQFALPAGTPLDGLNRIYLLDPAGRLMMSYPAQADPSGMRKDLARLLKVSQIG